MTTTTRFESFGELSTKQELSTRKDSSVRREVSTRQEVASSTTRVHQEISHQVVSQSQQVRREFRLSDLPDPNGLRRGQRALTATGHEYSPSPEPEAVPRRQDDGKSSERQYKAHLVVKLSDERTSPPSDGRGKKSSRSSEDRGTPYRTPEDRGSSSRDPEDRGSSSRASEDRGSSSQIYEDRGSSSRASEDRGSSSRDRGSSSRVYEDRGSLRRSEDRSVEERTQTVRTSSLSSRSAGPGRPERTVHSQSRSPSPPVMLREDLPWQSKPVGSHFKTEKISTATRSYGSVESSSARSRSPGDRESPGRRGGSTSDGERSWSVDSTGDRHQNGRPTRTNGQRTAARDGRPRDYADSALLRPPVLLRPLSELSVRPGGVVQLRLIVDALPQPTISWYKDGRHLQLRPDASYNATEDGGVCTLTLPRAHPEDSGVYCCVATNHLGTVCSEAQVCVAGEH